MWGCTVYLKLSRRLAIQIDTCPGVKRRVAISSKEGQVSRDPETRKLEGLSNISSVTGED